MVRASPRRAANAAAQKRLDLDGARAQAVAVRHTFPQVAEISIDLQFSGQEPLPSPQRHAFYPAARAFFQFACPCTDCDGGFDLTSAVAELATRGAESSRTQRSVSGRWRCPGVRWRDSERSAPCSIELDFQVMVTVT